MKGAQVWSLSPVFTGPAEEKEVQKETEKQLVKKKKTWDNVVSQKPTEESVTLIINMEDV